MSSQERKALDIQSLPETLIEALNEFQKNQVIKEAVGEHIFNRFLEAKKSEWNMFRTTVHPWEREQYLTRY